MKKPNKTQRKSDPKALPSVLWRCLPGFIPVWSCGEPGLAQGLCLAALSWVQPELLLLLPREPAQTKGDKLSFARAQPLIPAFCSSAQQIHPEFILCSCWE